MRKLYVFVVITLTLAYAAPVAGADDSTDPTGPVLSLLRELQADPDTLDSVATQLQELMSSLDKER